MSTLAFPAELPGMSFSPAAWYSELRRRQPQLAATSQLFLLAVLPCLIAMLVDPRTVNGVSGWIKPAKFFVSLALYYATLAWFFGYLPAAAQRSVAGRFVIWAPIIAGCLELAWMVAAAAHGVPSHFNRADPAWRIAYAAAGVVVMPLLLATLVQGVMLARQREVAVAPAFRLSLVLGSVIAFGATLIVASYLASQAGHGVGGISSDASGLPLLGWSRTGGDLRVSHFWALHAQQLVPLTGWLIVRARIPANRLAVCAVAIAYVGLVAFTFVQALRGEAFLT
jgi:hypothetical protein